MLKTIESFSIKNWSDDDKPREKLAQKGRSVLSDAELVAILIRSGSKKESAVELSKKILATVDYDLNKLGRLSLKQLIQFKGIGDAKAIAIIAALELGKRRREETPKKRFKISDSKSAFQLLQPTIGELPHEEFWIIYLNNANTVIHTVQLSKGGITGTLVDVRLAMKYALELGAVAIILAHNHPSGILKPSKADRQITAKLQRAAQTLDIQVLDHIIITREDYFSFADHKVF